MSCIIWLCTAVLLVGPSLVPDRFWREEEAIRMLERMSRALLAATALLTRKEKTPVIGPEIRI